MCSRRQRRLQVVCTVCSGTVRRVKIGPRSLGKPAPRGRARRGRPGSRAEAARGPAARFSLPGAQ